MGLKTWLRLRNPEHRHPLADGLWHAQQLSGQERLRSLLRSLTPKRAVGVEKARIGCGNDGGYVMLDDFGGIVAAVSCGVGINWSWDRDIAKRGILVRQFDEMIAPSAGQGPLFDFRNLRVSGSKGPGRITLDAIADGLNVEAATALLKIDIEGEEWDALRVASDVSLSSFAQIAVEFHDLGLASDANRLSKYEATIERLTRQFQSVHVHGNNHSPFVSVFNIAFPDVLEVTFASRRRYRFTDSDETFPTSLDMPNKKDALDLWLGTFAY